MKRVLAGRNDGGLCWMKDEGLHLETSLADMVELPDWGVRRSDASVTDSVTPQDECFREEEDAWSDISEPSSEAWVANPSPHCEDNALIMSDPSPLVTHEPENWDAEILEIESPYDEEDVADVCEWRIGSQQNCSEDSYLPSSHHTPSIQLPVYSACYIVVGQFEDAEQ
ncbi:coordinator of PRMT5 and differentiation stimulator isoform X2 [Ranitomeya imitator]|uniref:coordinator of PRMT5 and differentiation stimulator isoform X2 n=1 Tax=Ranitomeya imitator TaxID=111125 RepID=UPI0037E79737